jgi:hypothetical protein
MLIFIGSIYKYHKNKEALLDARKEAALEVNAEKKKYMFILSPYCRIESLHKDSCLEIWQSQMPGNDCKKSKLHSQN